MEQDQSLVLNQQSKKRKLPEEYHHDDHDDHGMLDFSLDELLNQDLLERVLSWLPTSSFFRLRSVCKRWSSVAASASFRLACSQIPSRDPWFFMVDNHLDQSIVFDTSERNWKHLKRPLLLHQNHPNRSNLIPVAASGGLICFRSTVSGGFLISNPVTSACRELPPPLPPAFQNQTIHAIAMNSPSRQHSSSYSLVLVSGELPHLSVWVYESGKDCWGEEIKLSRKMDEDSQESDVGGDEVLYFLSKAGDVVATNMQRSPSKQYSSVITVKDGEEIIYFLSSSGTVLACNLVKKSFFEYPRLLPVCFEYSIDIVECKGEMLVVVLSEFLESASLRVWRFSEEEKEEKDRSWCQIAAMPPSMAHEFYGKKADINCVGSGDQKRLMICVNSGEFSRYMLCDLEANDWTELPKCVVDGKPKEFMSAFSFEPRIEARV
ncbi:F-box domain [Macleaya cordata]|uniref:F-box domain n=1 Tax=Macleaya cordata TaxID=56857 RepID=A0A200QD33_MACCD|nr:F-box domain [Macleaya cordata]